MNQHWFIVSWTFRYKFKWNFDWNKTIFIQENAFKIVFFKMAGILFGQQCVESPIIAIQGPISIKKTF